MQRSTMNGRKAWSLLLLIGWVLPLPGVAQHVTDNVQALGGEAQRQRWEEGLALLGVGKFDEASKVIHDVAGRAADNTSISQVDKWLKAFDELQAERKNRIQADYEQYVQWAKEDMAAGRWRQAIRDCDLAYNYAVDEDEFRQEAWLQEIVDGVVAKAEAYEQDNEWYKAASIYARLNDMFYLDESYREALERCQAHIRIDLTYIPAEPDEDSEDEIAPPDWRSMVINIVPRMTRNALRKVHNDYIREADFKEMTVSALEQVLRFVHEPGIEKVFPALADEDDVATFSGRVQTKLDEARERDEVTLSDLVAYFNQVLTLNDESGMLPQNVLIYEFTHGALQSLDKFTDMIWPSDVMEFNKHTQGRFSGVGISIRKGFGEPIKVITPLEDTPAYIAGIQPGDLITKINGKSAKKYRITDAVREITGPPGTTVTLTIERMGVPEPFDVTLERQEITIFTVKGHQRDENGKWQFLVDEDEKIAYLRLTNFTDGSIDELRGIIDDLEADGLRGLIFDLRANPGGPLKSAIEVADLFLDEGKNIVSTRDREGKIWEMSSTDAGAYTDFPMIVLVNSVSASASEIVAGALQVHHRALVLGERSFGKGSVQQVLHLNNSGQAYLKLTTARYYLPNGRSLHREEGAEIWGVDPDVEVKLVPKEIIKGNELRLRTDILKGKGQDALSDEALDSIVNIRGIQDEEDTEDKGKQSEDASESHESSATRPAGAEGDEDPDDDEEWIIRDDENNYPSIDPQLEAAMLLMRVRLETGHPWPLRSGGGAEVAARGAAGKGG